MSVLQPVHGGEGHAEHLCHLGLGDEQLLSQRLQGSYVIHAISITPRTFFLRPIRHGISSKKATHKDDLEPNHRFHIQLGFSIVTMNPRLVA